MGAYIGGGASGGAFGCSIRSPLAAWPAEVSLGSSLVASRAGALTGFPAPAADTGPENTALSQLETAHANWEKVTSYGINTEEKAWKFAVTLIIAVTCAAARAATAHAAHRPST